MGVTGLWRLIEPAGKPVPVESLENKVLAVDISIWLHQMVKGYQDAKGAPMPNAHLMGLFQRLCKLLYFRIKPVFVFDGGFPDLKKETIAKRQDNKSKYNSESERLKREIVMLLGKKTAIGNILGKQISPKKVSGLSEEDKDDLFKLPALPKRDEETDSESEDEQSSSTSSIDLHTVDIESDKFKSMPVKDKYDLLVELKETRKMNSWGKLHTLPKKSDNFSDFQMQRLLKRRKIQECLEETEKEMGDGTMSLNELESLLNEEGIDTKIESLPSRRIASNNTTRFLLINNVKQALIDAKKNQELLLNKRVEVEEKVDSEQNTGDTKLNMDDEVDDDLQKAIKMSLECVDEPNTSVGTSKTDESWTSFLSDSDYSNSCSDNDDGYEQPDMSSAKAYIMQYSDFTYKAIDNIVASKKHINKNKNTFKASDIIEDLKKEKSVIMDKMDLSSDENVKLSDKDDLETSSGYENKIKISDTTMHTAEASVICLEDKSSDAIVLDTSTDEDTKRSEILNKPSGSIETKEDEESTDSEFEEVPETETKLNKSVVELTLNMGEAVDDDIFADVFEDQKQDDVLRKQMEEDNSECINITNNAIEKKHSNLEDSYKEDTIMSPSDSNKSERDIKTMDKTSSDYKNELTSVHFEENTSPEVISDNVLKNSTIEPKETNESLKNNPIVIESTMSSKPALTSEELNTMMTEMQNKEEDLLQEKGRLDRIGRNITEQMTKEAQELLQIFGIPYIVAPMEAEAQCAFLESVKLTDGTITDDSDIWLFGGRTVYKNFFNQKKHVMQFLSERIEKSFNLSREQLILLALLVGSDYTTGISGVGPVTALEILASFPFKKKQLFNETIKQAKYSHIVAGLQEFKQWVQAGKRTDNTSLKKKLKNVQLTDDFPSVRVVQAYLEPYVEKSDEKFTWGHIDITILRDYAKTKFGWSQNKLDEIIKPVLSRLINSKTQMSIQDYFKKKIEFQSLEDQMSKRVKAAVQRMDPNKAAETNTVEENQPKTRKRKAIKGKTTNKDPENLSSEILSEPSTSKKKKDLDSIGHITKVVDANESSNKAFDVIIPKTDRFQELIPQREKDKQNILQNKLKAIEIFRKSKIDKNVKRPKRRVNKPKEHADLSESSDEN
ncbi:DNA excision repair protein ERCC-5 homolog [Battus philenor]|uniref:DNA excision repair protein ERCC-5 homolog n=1 Tax=Battus philenor TaxID=42288 RepID=UPI0035D0E100